MMFDKPISDEKNLILVSTPFVPGYRIVEVLGFTWGLVVRSRGLGRNIVAMLRTIPGGEIKEYTGLLNAVRSEAIRRMEAHAREMGANAVVSIAFDSSSISQMMSEIIAYGTAVRIEPTSHEVEDVRLV